MYIITSDVEEIKNGYFFDEITVFVIPKVIVIFKKPIYESKSRKSNLVLVLCTDKLLYLVSDDSPE
jgi:hypothetical protein